MPRVEKVVILGTFFVYTQDVCILKHLDVVRNGRPRKMSFSGDVTYAKPWMTASLDQGDDNRLMRVKKDLSRDTLHAE